MTGNFGICPLTVQGGDLGSGAVACLIIGKGLILCFQVSRGIV